MEWRPTTEEGIWDLINDGYSRMTLPQKRLWDVIKIVPTKWKQHPWGDEGCGFWAVAVFGDRVIWYNDIESGFNTSSYSSLGEIDDYFCNQDELDSTVSFVLTEIIEGQRAGYHMGPPRPGAYNPD